MSRQRVSANILQINKSNVPEVISSLKSKDDSNNSGKSTDYIVTNSSRRSTPNVEINSAQVEQASSYGRIKRDQTPIYRSAWSESSRLSDSSGRDQSSKSPEYLKYSGITDRLYTMRELACNLRDAIVTITGESALTSLDNKTSLYLRNGNGFFIKGHYIICPADLILISPSEAITNDRIPSYDLTTSSDDKLIFPNIKSKLRQESCDNLLESPSSFSEKYLNALIRASKILVDVSNVNGSGQSYTYDADIVGIDGAANIAVLRIDPITEWNKSNPPIRVCHPFLQWGKSRSSCPGDTILVIGNIAAPSNVGLSTDIKISAGAENAVAIGNISDNRYVFPGGQVPGELLLLSNIMGKGSQRGLPVITIDGTVIGMTLFITSSNLNSQSTYNIALSEFFMRRPVKALIRSYQDNAVPVHYRGFIQSILDPIGNYNRFNKAWLGIGGILMCQEDYNTNIHYDISDASFPSGNLGGGQCDLSVNFSRIPILDDDGQLSNGPDNKEIVGYRVLAIASPTGTTGIFVPGNSPTGSLMPNLKHSPLYEILSYGDIITHINGCPLGDRKGQISPSLVMWRVRPGDTVKIMYKKQSERFKNAHEVTICSSSYEPLLDFPFYAFPLSSLSNMLPTLI